MMLVPGARVGPYEICEPIGAGGMGEVFRARDTRLDRDVAIKMLPAHVAGDHDALARLEREAKALASLSHPNIVAIHDFGAGPGIAYAVMELLSGETLRESLAAHPPSPRKAVDQAIQIARGLAAAHDRGVVHRDLKPANIFVTKDGHLKILDFGLAAQRNPTPSGDDAESPTLSRHTDPGTVLGTTGYMSPEQVAGRASDHRSDIFAFGCVLYEMLTGARAFRRETDAETMAAILKEGIADIPAGIAASLPGIERLLLHCLEKRPEERFQSAHDLVFHLETIVQAPGTSSLPGLPARSSRRSKISRVAALFGVMALGAAVGMMVGRRSPQAVPSEPAQLRPLTFSGYDREPSASPDGRLLAFSSSRDGRARIWIKQIRGGEAPLTEGEDRHPRFSPDGSSILFLRAHGLQQTIYRVPLVGGEPRKLVEDALSADWSPDGRRILFIRRRVKEGMRFSSLRIADLRDGAEQELFTAEGLDLAQPRFSPDGRSVAVIRGIDVGLTDRNDLVVLDVATRKARSVTPRGYGLGCLAWCGDGANLVLARSGTVVGDPSGFPGRVYSLNLGSGQERSLFWTIGLFGLSVGGSITSAASCDVPSDGRLVFTSVAGTSAGLSEIDLKAGTDKTRSLTVGGGWDRQPAYSPGDQSIIFSSNRSGNLDLWLLDRRTGALRQLTDDAAQDWDPGFTPDGRHLLWSSDRSGHLEIWMAAADGSGPRQLTHDGVDAENPTAGGDGAWVVYWTSNPKSPGIWKIRLDGSEPTRVVEGQYQNPETSPDGRYAAFLYARASGMTTIRVVELASAALVPFEVRVAYPTGAPLDVTWGRVRWTPDGRRLAFIGTDAAGLSGVFEQDFIPGRDTTQTRRPVVGFSPNFITESLGLSPDGGRITISTLKRFSSLWLAEGLPGVEARRRQAMQ
jgi:eukaryotic-like serine/threonine-protein kinase